MRNWELGAVGEDGRLPTWVVPPEGFATIDKNGFKVISLVGQELLAEVEPLACGYDGWITLLGLNCTKFSLTSFQIYQGGAPLRDYTYLNTNIGAPETPRQVYIRLLPNQDVKLFALSTALGAGVRWSMFGWKFPIR